MTRSPPRSAPRRAAPALVRRAATSTAWLLAWALLAAGGVAQADEDLERLREAASTAEAAGEPAEAAVALDRLAARLLQRRRYEEAVDVARRAVAAANDDPEATLAARATRAVRLSTACFWAGRIAEGVAAGEDAVDLARRAFGDDDPRTGAAWSVLASNLQRRREPVAALLTARRGLRCRGLAADVHARLLTTACEAAIVAGRPAEAREIVAEAEAEATSDEDPTRTALRENLAGQIEFALGRYAEAGVHYRRLAALQEARPQTTAAERAATASLLGQIALGEGRFDEAAERFASVRAAFAATPTDPRFVRASLDAAQTAAGRGDGAAALRYVAEAEAYGRDDPDPQVRARIVVLGAAALQAAGRHDEALARLRPLLDELAAEPKGREAVHLQAWANAARAQAASGRGPETLAAYRRASEIAREYVAKRTARLSEAERIAAAATPRAALDGLVSAAAEYAPAGEDLVAVANELLAWKGAISRSVRAERAALRAADTPEVRAAIAETAALERRIAGRFAAEAAASRPGAAAAPEESIRDLLRERERLERERLVAADSSVVARAPTAAELIAALPPDSVLLDYFVFERSRPGAPRTGARGVPSVGVAAYRGGRATPTLAFLGGVAEVRTAVDAHLRFASRARADEPGMAEPAGVAAAAARRAVWEPIVEATRGARRVFVASDGFLAALPFDTLPADDATRLLAEDHVFVALPSAADLLGSRSPRASAGVLLIGDVEFGAPTDPPAAADSRAARGRRFRPLPQSRAEIDAIAARWAAAGKAAGDVVRLTGRDAHVDAVAGAARGKRIVHFATHAVYGADEREGPDGEPAPEDSRGGVRTSTARQGASPSARSGVVLSSPTGAALWSAGEAAFADLDACELVVVSACDSGLGAPRLGEGMLGLRRAFALAGARATTTAVWPVHDAAASAFMQAFHARLARGEPPEEALRGAKLDRLAATRSAAVPHGAVADFGAFVLEVASP